MNSRIPNSLNKAGVPTNGVNEVKTLTIDAAGGTFTLTYAAQTTSAIAFNALASVVQAALIALSTIGAGNISVSGSAGGPYTITFLGTLSGLPQTLTSTATSLTGGAGTATVTQATLGVRGDYRSCALGQVVIDTTNNRIYENTGTRAKPVWTEPNTAN